MGDEGGGIHAVGALERAGLPPEVSVVDGGTLGFQLLSPPGTDLTPPVEAALPEIVRAVRELVRPG